MNSILQLCFVMGLLVPVALGQLVGYHPDALSQPTALGRTPRLHADGGHLILGYGDYGANTGPINVRTYDIAAGTFSGVLATAPTEEINQWRTIGGKIYGLHIDADYSPTQGGYVSGTVGGTWSNTTFGVQLHTHDFTSYGGALYAAGSRAPGRSQSSTIYKSIDGGLNWTLDHEIMVTTNATWFSRFYDLYAVGGKLYAHTQTSATTTLITAFDGTSWTTVTSTVDAVTGDHAWFMDSQTIAGEIVGRWDESSLRLSDMYRTDGPTSAYLPLPGGAGGTIRAWDHYAHNGSLYVLAGDQRVIKTSDLISWSEVVTGVVASGRSIAVTGDCDVFIGATDAGLYRYDCLPEPPKNILATALIPTNGAVTLRLSWDTVPTWQYSLQSNTNLVIGGWTTLTNYTANSNQLIWESDLLAPGNLIKQRSIYRIRCQPPVSVGP